MTRRDEFGAVDGYDVHARVTDRDPAPATDLHRHSTVGEPADATGLVVPVPASSTPSAPADLDVSMRDIPVSDHAVSDMAVSDMAVSDSVAIDSVVTEPVVTEPVVSEPAASDPVSDASVDAAPSEVSSWWQGRYGRQLLFEVLICGGLLMLYRSIRLVTKTDLRSAFANAREVVAFESWLGLPFEDNVQAFLLDHPSIIQFLNHYYVLFHFPAAIALLVWLYLRHPGDYRPVRNLMAFVTFLALIIHLVFPLAPPRMMSGFVDTMARYGPNIYPPNAVEGAANQIAAMPSLHFGWALIEALAVIIVLSSRWRYIIVIHPLLMTLAIIATANHWWIDAATAGLIVMGGLALGNVARARIGDRQWSWTAFRFQTREGIEQLEAHANSACCEHIDPIADETASACASNARFGS